MPLSCFPLVPSFYEDMVTEPSYYFYPNVIEMKLKGLVGAGNIEETEQLLDYIFTELPRT
jgi:hypothetical protein